MVAAVAWYGGGSATSGRGPAGDSQDILRSVSAADTHWLAETNLGWKKNKEEYLTSTFYISTMQTDKGNKYNGVCECVWKEFSVLI